MRAFRIRFNFVSGKDLNVTLLAESREELIQKIYAVEDFAYTVDNQHFIITMRHVESVVFSETNDPTVIEDLISKN
ncbi:hypothetical protein ACR6EC_19750 [Bacillus subtilis]|uniref:hypothetical protein n=1 Tax=Bacillus subtilis TaxID=1423 RepID=UPI00102E6D22|nr:hypothetical protein [Bacillus subtilis]TAH79743.1 hypothetical protein ES060_16545 [Bacillus subtilis]TAH86778.1 hypothetical protein ES066_16550 [Bacillus subtilis]